MKKTSLTTLRAAAIPFLAAALLASCSQGPETPLENLKFRHDSLAKVKENIEDELAELEAEIQKRDSTVEYPLVTTYVVKSRVFKHYFEVYGNVETNRTATLYAEIPGKVEAIAVREGQTVSRGQVLVRLDAKLIAKQIAGVETSLKLAKTLYEKQKRLWDQNIGSEVQYLEAKNRKESLEDQLATLHEQRSQSTVTAPFGGVVDKIFPKIGEMAGPQMPVARIVSLQSLYATAEVSERYAGKVAVGDTALVALASGDTVHTEVSRVGSFINATNRSFEIQVTLPDTLPDLLPNSLVRLRVNDLTVPNAVTVPNNMIMQDGEGRSYVFVSEERDGQPISVKRMVHAGQSQNSTTLVTKGLTPGDRVIDRGSRTVRDQDPIEIASN